MLLWRLELDSRAQANEVANAVIVCAGDFTQPCAHPAMQAATGSSSAVAPVRPTVVT